MAEYISCINKPVMNPAASVYIVSSHSMYKHLKHSHKPSLLKIACDILDGLAKTLNMQCSTEHENCQKMTTLKH